MKMHSNLLALVTAGVILIPAYHLSWADSAKEKQATKQEAKAAKKASSKAKIYFENREFDFGNVEQGEKVTHIFSFTNKGTDPLVIDKVQTSCGCTAAITSAKTIPPKGKGTIESTFNSARFNGQIHKTITVYSNDPEEPAIRLKIRGKVNTDLTIVPSRELFFGLIEYKKTASKSFLLTQGSDKPLEVTKAECDLGFITTEIVPASTGNKKMYQIMLHVTEKAPLGRFEGNVKIYTNLDKHKVIERKVMGVVKEMQKTAPTSSSKTKGAAKLPPFIKELEGIKPPPKKRLK